MPITTDPQFSVQGSAGAHGSALLLVRAPAVTGPAARIAVEGALGKASFHSVRETVADEGCGYEVEGKNRPGIRS
ncbi:hypothetical protein [Streptomyces sp. NPDC101150]|uniref:hypothetical protein n=1 Tax=Streptomyces sp. NPDC101150 TaxID=3366114 RepID=UPI0037F67752